MIDKFIEFLNSQVGKSIYVWGAQGESDITEEWIRKRENNDEKQVKRVLKLWDKLKGQGISPIHAYDCSGLIVSFLIKNKIISGDMSSRSLYAKSTEIKREDLKAGDFVFRHNGTKIYHVGVYVGNNMVIECMGRDVGVVKRDINASGSTYWNRYGRFAKLAGIIEKETPKCSTFYLTDKPYMRGSEIKELQTRLIMLGYDVGSTGADGIFGKNTDKALRLFQERAKKLTDGVYDSAMRELIGL
ncbi:MAG: C40 family peptidase [Clostridia bacterium]|nr:C40 family peptidase [Clostridia bacterium]